MYPPSDKKLGWVHIATPNFSKNPYMVVKNVGVLASYLPNFRGIL